MVCNVYIGICSGISMMVSIFQLGCFIINQYQWNYCIGNIKSTQKQYTETFISMFFITDLNNMTLLFLVELSLEMFHCSLRNFMTVIQQNWIIVELIWSV